MLNSSYFIEICHQLSNYLEEYHLHKTTYILQNAQLALKQNSKSLPELPNIHENESNTCVSAQYLIILEFSNCLTSPCDGIFTQRTPHWPGQNAHRERSRSNARRQGMPISNYRSRGNWIFVLAVSIAWYATAQSSCNR